jgi:hypothetical protein
MSGLNMFRLNIQPALYSIRFEWQRNMYFTDEKVVILCVNIKPDVSTTKFGDIVR